MKGPAGRLPGGAWCSWCRRGAHSDEVTSLTVTRAAVWSTIFLPVTWAAMSGANSPGFESGYDLTDRVDAIMATRKSVFPEHGLMPEL